jgi:hypothetical protein
VHRQIPNDEEGALVHWFLTVLYFGSGYCGGYLGFSERAMVGMCYYCMVGLCYYCMVDICYLGFPDRAIGWWVCVTWGFTS